MHDELVRVAPEPEVEERLLQLRDALGAEHALHPGLLGAVAHQPRAGPTARQQGQRPQHHRLARAGLAGEHVQPRTELELRRVHAEQGTEHSHYVPDEIVDRFCVIGDLDAVRGKLEHLRSLGVGEINLYPHVAGFESVIEAYGRDIVPGMRAAV